MRQDEVLLVRDADLVVRIVLRQVGDGVHLVGAGVAGDRADRFQRDGHRGHLAGRLVRRGCSEEKKLAKAQVPFDLRRSPPPVADRFFLSSSSGGAKSPRESPRPTSFSGEIERADRRQRHSASTSSRN